MSIRSLLLAIIFFCTNQSKAADTLQVTQLLHRITQFQVKENGVFPKGLFTSYRTYAHNQSRAKADINIFFTGLIVFTLENLKHNFTPYQQQLVNEISLNANPVFAKFKNKKGRETYNFWPTDTPKIFPNAGWLNLMDKAQAIPDDMDDTVIMLLALNVDSNTAANVHQLMQGYTNKKSKQITNTLSSVKDLPAYSVWFGKKMPIDFDISVLSNVLYFVKKYNLQLTSADSASVQVIARAIKENKHLSSANFISPHYGTAPIILYHLSRLMALATIPELDMYKSALINQTIALQQVEKGFMNQVILSSALLNWGIQPARVHFEKINNLQSIIEDESFSFFIANMASMLPNHLKKIFTASSLGRFSYYCPAYNNVLLIENIVLASNHKNNVFNKYQ